MPDTTTPKPNAILLVETLVMRFDRLTSGTTFLRITETDGRKRLSPDLWKKDSLLEFIANGNCCSSGPSQDQHHDVTLVPDDELVFVVTWSPFSP
jgi:hypothetical protein